MEGSREFMIDIKADVNQNMQDLRSMLMDWEKVKDFIYPVLCNTGWNHELLEEMPHRPFKDLSITYYVRLIESETGNKIIRINNHMLEIWERDETVLYLKAMENQQRCPGTIQDISKLLNIHGLQEDAVPAGGPLMYVLSNQEGVYGSGEILNLQQLQEFSRKLDSSFYLIPSSIHEFILLLDTEKVDEEDINEIIQCVNQTAVSEGERLSDHTYYFDKDACNYKMRGVYI